MAINKLQKDFTTPEQSKRLLELGVPADSANYYYGKDGKLHHIDGTIPYSLLWETGCTPCWSFGRLVKIYYEVCIKPADPLQKWMSIEMALYGLVEQMIMRFVHDRDKLDFSKFEE